VSSQRGQIGHPRRSESLESTNAVSEVLPEQDQDANLGTDDHAWMQAESEESRTVMAS